MKQKIPLIRILCEVHVVCPKIFHLKKINWPKTIFAALRCAPGVVPCASINWISNNWMHTQFEWKAGNNGAMNAIVTTQASLEREWGTTACDLQSYFIQRALYYAVRIVWALQMCETLFGFDAVKCVLCCICVNMPICRFAAKTTQTMPKRFRKSNQEF